MLVVYFGGSGIEHCDWFILPIRSAHVSDNLDKGRSHKLNQKWFSLDRYVYDSGSDVSKNQPSERVDCICRSQPKS